MRRRLRFGLLGTGFWADTGHAPGLRAHADVDLVAVWGRDAARAAAVAERHGVRASTDLDALLDEVDAVAIAVAPDAQAELACRAADAGCHLLLEKPLALSPAAASAVVASVHRAGVAALVFFTSRFTEPTASWLAEVAGAGDWHRATATLVAPVLTTSSPYRDSRWRLERGALWDAGPHMLAVLLPALGPVAEVAARRGRGDTVHLTLAHRAGGRSSVTLSLTAPEAEWNVSLWRPGAASVAPAPTPDALAGAYGRAVSELLTAIDAGRPHPCGVAFAAEVVGVLAVADSRLAGGEPVSGDR